MTYFLVALSWPAWAGGGVKEVPVMRMVLGEGGSGPATAPGVKVFPGSLPGALPAPVVQGGMTAAPDIASLPASAVQETITRPQPLQPYADGVASFRASPKATADRSAVLQSLNTLNEGLAKPQANQSALLSDSFDEAAGKFPLIGASRTSQEPSQASLRATVDENRRNQVDLLGKVKSADGGIQELASGDFQRWFGVEFLSVSQPSPELSPSFRKNLEKTARKQARLDALHDFLNESAGSILRRFAQVVVEGFLDFSQVVIRRRYGQDIDQGRTAQVYISRINGAVGHGLFADEDIGRDQMIGEYTGIIRKKTSAEKTVQDAPPTNVNAYLMGYSPRHKLFRDHIIDAKSKGNYMRFINHSKRYANAVMEDVFYSGEWHKIIVATKPISKGSQIFFDYGEGYWAYRKIDPLELGPN